MEFKSPNLWLNLEYHLQKVDRYDLSDELTDFINTLLAAAEKRTHILKKGEIYYRARIGCRESKKRHQRSPLPKKEMLKPSPIQARDGRINPKGISYLYLSTTINTAIAETRPWLDQFVSVATYVLSTDLKIVNAISNTDFLDTCLPWDKDASPEKKEERIWYDIDNALSRPVRDGELTTEYVPTQYLAERFKKAGYEGLAYKSSVSKDGHNIVLFNAEPPWHFKIKKVSLFRVKEINYTTAKWAL